MRAANDRFSGPAAKDLQSRPADVDFMPLEALHGTGSSRDQAAPAADAAEHRPHISPRAPASDTRLRSLAAR
jgi:hypothetical protein